MQDEETRGARPVADHEARAARPPTVAGQRRWNGFIRAIAPIYRQRRAGDLPSGTHRLLQLIAIAQAKAPAAEYLPIEQWRALTATTRSHHEVYTRRAKDMPGRTPLPIFERRLTLRSYEFLAQMRWGDDYADPVATLAALGTIAPVRLIPSALTQALQDAAGVTPETRGEWQRAQTWGMLADIYLFEMLGYERLLTENKQPAKAQALRRGLDSLVDQDTHDLLAKVRTDRGLLVCGTHTGAFRFGYNMIKEACDEVVLLSAAPAGEGRFSTDDPVRALYQLTKSLRVPGTVALIGADGPIAASTREIDLLGLKLPIAMGPPTAVYNAKCDCAFLLAMFRDGKIVLELHPAPPIDRSIPFSAWADRWIDGYRAVLESVMHAGPENQRCYSGVWRMLIDALERSDPERSERSDPERSERSDSERSERSNPDAAAVQHQDIETAEFPA